MQRNFIQDVDSNDHVTWRVDQVTRAQYKVFQVFFLFVRKHIRVDNEQR